MSDVAIRAEGLSKRFRIGELRKYKALRDTLAVGLYAPFRAAASLLKDRGSHNAGRPSNSFIWALKDVSFEIKRGEVVGIIGRNGAGKSTLLRILSRITQPTAGYAEVRGRVGSLLEVGTGFHSELTGRENIYLNGAILGMRRTEIDRRFDEIVAFSEVEKFIDTPVKYYSSGMSMRLAFAVAAHLEPEILLVDEVLAVGDAAFQKKCLGKMGDVAQAGRTVLFVSHNMGAIRSLCQRGLLFKEGGLAAAGSTEEVLSLYLTRLSEQTSRPPSMTREVGILECKVLAISDAPKIATELFADQAIGLRFTVRCPEDRKGRITLGGRLTDLTGNPIGSVYSDYYGVYYECDPNQMLQVDVINEGLRLAPGSYIFWPEMWSGFRFERSLVKSPVQCISFHVLPSDVFGGGYEDFSGDGPALWRAVWSTPQATLER